MSIAESGWGGAGGNLAGPDEGLEGREDVRSQLAAIVESSEDAIIGKTLDGIITSWNRGAERIFGYTAPEVVGQPISMLAWPGHEEDAAKILARIRKGERVEHYETMRRTKDGRQIAVSLTISPVRDKSGVIVGASKVARDVSSRRDADRTRALLAAIVESSDDAIISKDLNGIVTSWNKGAERVFGYTAEEMIGAPIARLRCADTGDDMARILEKVRAGERIDHHQTRRRCKDGREITVSLTVSPIRDSAGRIIGASKVARDITSQRQAEEALRRAEKLAVAGRLAASIAHEINNPLEAVTNLLYLIEREPLPEQARKYLATAQQELSRVGHITVKTLGFYREPPKDLPVDVAETLDEALALYQGRFVHHGVKVERQFVPVPALPGNAGELRQVIANLVGNAVDAMGGGGTLTVRVRPASSAKTGCKGVRITVADTGAGMSAETQRRLFEPFYTTKGATGTGLGLWVSSEIVAKHGGCLMLRSSQEPSRQGSVFVIFLPGKVEDKEPARGI